MLAGPCLPGNIEAVWQDYRCFLEPDNSTVHGVDTQSTMGSVVLLVDGPQPTAIKIRGDDDDRWLLSREAAYLCLLNDAPVPPPLHVPRVLEDSTFGGPPYYLAMERARGRVLGREEVAQFSPLEKMALGYEMGRFAAWMSQVVEPGEYKKTLYQTSTEVFDRATNYRVFAGMRDTLCAVGCSNLARVLFEVIEELGGYMECKTEPVYIGHDDIRPTNISFEYDEELGGWKPAGIFDFDLMKPTTADREFRHLRMIDRLVSETAAAAFETATGYRVYSEEIDFWARFQTASAMASNINTILTSEVPDTSSRRAIVAGNYRAMHEMFPGRDWSELDRFVA